MKNDEILHKWVNGTISEEELAQFKLRPEYDSLVELYDHTTALRPPKINQEAILATILSADKQESSPVKAPSKTRPLAWVKYAAAACVIVIAGVFFMTRGEAPGTFITKADESIEMQLPDGSYFAMEENTRLQFDPETFTTNRSIIVDGAATLEVAKGGQFIVETSQGKVEVLGTTFKVSSDDDNLHVSCQEGKVRVSTLNGELSDVITADQTIRIEDNTALVVSRDNITTLKNVPLGSALELIDEIYDVLISTVDIDLEQRITCSVQHDDLAKALMSALQPVGVNFNIVDENTVVLSK